jgi:ABC-2 type transport system permease protein
MRKLLYIVQKEFIQIFRNKAILPIITIAPILQLIVLSFAASNEVKDVRLTVVDHDRSSYSRQLTHQIEMSDRFRIIPSAPKVTAADNLIQRDFADIIMVIPAHFERSFLVDKTADLQLMVNAINGQQASVGASYLNSIIQAYNANIRIDAEPQILTSKKRPFPQIEMEHSNWYNSDLNYQDFMVPGILGELITILVMLLTAMNIVREREIGTIEQINVTPIRKWQFILGKMIPFLIIGLAILTVGLIVGKLIFDVPMRGNLAIVFAYCVVNITAVLGLGLFISNMANTQQQAMFITFFFAIIFILMCGLFTPIESMPKWAQYLTIPNPTAHFVYVMRSVLMKGSEFADIAYNFKVTAVLAICFNSLAILSYKKVV